MSMFISKHRYFILGSNHTYYGLGMNEKQHVIWSTPCSMQKEDQRFPLKMCGMAIESQHQL